ncbi:MAG: TauD/TfdA family dioxygenase [Pseudomonadota bacterium]|nr:TauD/TfdA family dioxygenase [Pseudomonadota bacterium]
MTLKQINWDALAAETGQIELPDKITAVPLTPLIGAELYGLDLTKPLNKTVLESITRALLRYKVLMIRSVGDWKMDVDEHTQFCQRLSAHWGLSADTEQKRLNHSQGLSVHPFLPWQRGYPHIWVTSSVTEGGQQFHLRTTEDVDNFEPFAARKLAKKADTSKSNRHQATDPHDILRTHKPGSFGGAALAQDSVNNGANAFHFDDGFFHHPPSAVVLNALVLPKVGGDTIFADMGAAYLGLPQALQERAKNLTQTMDWRHTFPIWEEEAERQLLDDDDDSFKKRVDKLKREYPPSQQPLIRQHPVTGELSIYANLGFTRHINDVTEQESRQLMALLCRMAERPEYQVRMRWQNEGDVCIYDNRNTNHYAVADYGNVGPRALHHIALLGEPTKDAYGNVIG